VDWTEIDIDTIKWKARFCTHSNEFWFHRIDISWPAERHRHTKTKVKVR
jgi:hypothetical protein